MVRAVLSHDETAVSSTPVSAASFPIWVIPVDKLLTLDTLQTHEEIKAKGFLVQWKEGDGDILFFSHTWLQYTFPDGKNNEKLTLLKQLVRAMSSGKITVNPNWSIEIQTQMRYRVKASALKRSLANGFVWLDIASIPQAKDARAEQILAIQSIPHYIAATLSSSRALGGCTRAVRRATCSAGRGVGGAGSSSSPTSSARWRSL